MVPEAFFTNAMEKTMSEINASSNGESNLSAVVQNLNESERLRDEVSDFVRDVSSVTTFDLERESDSRLTAFQTALKYVPKDKLPDLVKDLNSYVQSSPNLFSMMNEDTEEQLRKLKQLAGVD
jgi:hypothetical protein